MPTNSVRRIVASAACALGAFAPANMPNQAPPIRHVWVIVLENERFETTFGEHTDAPYLADTLTLKGAFLRQYYGIGHVSLDNYIAMISGIAPSLATQSDCGRFEEFVQTGTAPDGQPIGTGCVYPAHVRTIANQLSERGLTWRAYMEDMGKDPERERATCGHPAIGARDATQRATSTDQYATKHNPFMYFHSIIDSPMCDRNVVSLAGLEADLAAASRTPNFSFIAPSLCHDGHDRPCRDREPGGLVSADRFLAHWIPVITASKAYRDGGLIIITFDEAASADASACCDEQPGPNVKMPGAHGPGGGRVGAVLLSPYIKPGTVTYVPYNHYSMLRSMQNMFGLKHLGYAGQRGLVPFGADIFGNGRRK